MLPGGVTHAADLNAGFVEGVWFGTDAIVAGTPTRMYVAFRNTTERDLTGTITFTDNGASIGSSDVRALQGRIVEAWVDWKPSYGKHEIVASLTHIRTYPIGGTPETGTTEKTTLTHALFVDRDTDGDGILNEVDSDDDNDTVRDTAEVKNGTDPLVFNEPKKEEPTPDKNAEKDTSSARAASVRSTPSDEEVRGISISRREGLEQYVPENTAHTLLETVTATIGETKGTLDAYREQRHDALKSYFGRPDEKENTSQGTSSTSGIGTITRSELPEKESFLKSVLNAGKALLSTLYTFVLWITSQALAYPALVELGTLLLLLYIIYRIARRLGRRKQN